MAINPLIHYCGAIPKYRMLPCSEKYKFIEANSHDDTIVIAAEEEERVTVKILKQAESPTYTKNGTCEFMEALHVLYL